VPVSVSPVNVADPLEAVVAVALLGAAPAGLTVAVTTTPLWLTGLPLASSSWSTGCWAKATPFCAVLDGAVVSASFVAAPGVPSAVNVTGLPASPLDVAVSVLVPAVVLRVQLPTVAIPLPFVVWVPPVTLPLPAAGANVTVTLATGLAAPSRTITDGGEATPLPAGADCVVGLLAAIAAAVPALSVIAAVAGVSPVAPKLSV